MAALEGVESGLVIWNVLGAEQDTNDADREPNFGTFRGAVLFTPSRNSIRRLKIKPYTIFLDPILGDVGDDGVLRDRSGLDGVVLVSPFATGIEETGWTWEASFQINPRRKVSFSFQFQPGETVDLTKITPVLSSPGVQITKGDKGDAGTIAIDSVTTLSSTAPATVQNVGTPSVARLQFGIPRGVQGVKGDRGIDVRIESGYFSAPVIENNILSVSLTSNWGIDSTGEPYYDSAGAAPGEAAMLTVEPDGTLTLVRL